MNVNQINTAIIQGTFTNDQLSSMIDAVKFARSRLTQTIKWSLKVGDNVNFTSSKTGQNYTGVVMKVAIKYVTVKTITGMWRVPASMLTKVADEEFA
jgi:hypothetical protein